MGSSPCFDCVCKRIFVFLVFYTPLEIRFTIRGILGTGQRTTTTTTTTTKKARVGQVWRAIHHRREDPGVLARGGPFYGEGACARLFYRAFLQFPGSTAETSSASCAH